MSQFFGELSIGAQGLLMDVQLQRPVNGQPLYGPMPLKDPNDTLSVLIVDTAQKRQSDRVGLIELEPLYDDGSYTASYDLDEKWRQRKIISVGLRSMIRAVTEQDVHFTAVDFMILPENEASIRTAASVGATLLRPLTQLHADCTHDLYRVTKNAFWTHERQLRDTAA